MAGTKRKEGRIQIKHGLGDIDGVAMEAAQATEVEPAAGGSINLRGRVGKHRDTIPGQLAHQFIGIVIALGDKETQRAFAGIDQLRNYQEGVGDVGREVVAGPGEADMRGTVADFGDERIGDRHLMAEVARTNDNVSALSDYSTECFFSLAKCTGVQVANVQDAETLQRFGKIRITKGNFSEPDHGYCT